MAAAWSVNHRSTAVCKLELLSGGGLNESLLEELCEELLLELLDLEELCEELLEELQSKGKRFIVVGTPPTLDQLQSQGYLLSFVDS